MTRRLQFWFDYSCPYAYLGSTQVEALAASTNATLDWRPMLLGGVFRSVGTAQNLSEVLPAPKALHNGNDMFRWAREFDVEFAMPAGHPMRTVEALRATLACDNDPKVIHGFYRAYWVDARAPSHPDTIRSVVRAAGYDPDAVMSRIGSEEIKNDLRRRTDEAIALGIFGAPAFVLNNGELFWGQDRMHFVEQRLRDEALSHERWLARRQASERKGDAMPHTLEIYWDFSSPFAYLGSTQAESLAKRTNANLVWRPMLLGAVFKGIGQVEVPLMNFSASKQKYYYDDIHRWAEYWKVPFKWPSRFPMNTVRALRAYLALPEAKRDAFREKTFRAYWAEDRDINDEAVLRDLLGSDADEVLAKTQDPAIKQALFDATQRAIDAGVFGAPSWVVDEKELFWGQDRIALVERALSV